MGLMNCPRPVDRSDISPDLIEEDDYLLDDGQDD